MPGWRWQGRQEGWAKSRKAGVDPVCWGRCWRRELEANVDALGESEQDTKDNRTRNKELKTLRARNFMQSEEYRKIMRRGRLFVKSSSKSLRVRESSDWRDSGIAHYIRKQRMSGPPSSQQPLQLPSRAPWGDSGCRKAGSWYQVAKMHIKGMISVSPDSCVFPDREKH